MSDTPASSAMQLAVEIDPARGLSAAEVGERVAAGKINDIPEAPSRTLGEIVKSNLFTRFNFLMVSLGAVVIAAGSFGDALFLGVVVANTLIGIVQEVRAKQTLDKLAVLNAPRAQVVRDGEVRELQVRRLVLDDVIDLRAGLQVTADAVVRAAENLEVDESLLTGEADPVVKEPGDELLAGSFVVAGRGRAQVARIGRESYAAQLAEEAKRFTLVNSELRNDINRIILLVTYALVPTAILLFISQFRSNDGWQEAVVGAVAGVVGMVPEGLVLLTSVAFAVGVVTLARRRTLVQELPAIEVLARVDMLCLDKTGTITEGALDVSEVRVLDGPTKELSTRALAAFAAADPDPNATQRALRERFADGDGGWTVTGRVPFSSARKWSAASFAGNGSWVFGAPEMVLGDALAGSIAEAVNTEADAGRRVLVFAHAEGGLQAEQLPTGLEPVALVILEDRIRPDAHATLDYFAAQGVTLKVISGDNPRTVGAVAARAGLASAASLMDARQLPEDPEALADAVEATTVFGRVTPHQKRAMVKALQSRGHTVAMTGDGVNDVLALKDSDCGIAMASGSEATRAVAQLVLLDSSFAALPKVVAEGRRVINNIQRVASLFLVKTTYSFLLALATGVATFPYPFRPRHLTLISALTIGIPSFFLALAPNDERVRRGFMQRVLSVALPGGLIIAVGTLVGYGIARLNDDPAIGQDGLSSTVQLVEDRTVAVIIAAGIAFTILVRVARPLNAWRLTLVASMIVLFLLALLTPIGQDVFQLELPDALELGVAAAIVAVSWPFLEFTGRLVQHLVGLWFRRYDPDGYDPLSL